MSRFCLVLFQLDRDDSSGDIRTFDIQNEFNFFIIGETVMEESLGGLKYQANLEINRGSPDETNLEWESRMDQLKNSICDYWGEYSSSGFSETFKMECHHSINSDPSRRNDLIVITVTVYDLGATTEEEFLEKFTSVVEKIVTSLEVITSYLTFKWHYNPEPIFEDDWYQEPNT